MAADETISVHGPGTTCFVIGGRGYVGSGIVRAAEEADWNVTVVEKDDYDQHVGGQCDVLINANGNASRFRANQEPLFDFEASVRSVYRSLSDFSYSHYCLISSVDVYNDPTQEETTREDGSIDLLSLCPYGFHKRLAELLVMRTCNSWQVFRLAQMVGEGLKKGPLFDLLNGNPLWIDPETCLHFMNTRHVGEVVVELIRSAPVKDIYNVCGRDTVEFRRVLDLLPAARQDVQYAGGEKQIYRINTDKTDRLCKLPDSWDEVKDFVGETF